MVEDIKLSKEKKELVALLLDSRDSEIMRYIVNGLERKNPDWNFGYFVGYMMKHSKNINNYSSPSEYGTFHVDLREGQEWMRLEIEYENGVIDDIKDITPKERRYFT